MPQHHEALIFTMVLVSAADRDMNDYEMRMIGEIVNHLPIFRDFDRKQLTEVTENCAGILAREDGLDQVISAIRKQLPERLRETAYALACDVAAADGKVTQEEARLLELIRHGLDIERLIAAAVERGARARHIHL